MKALGIDIGGSGIKGALVDTETGILASDRIRIPTPENAKPDSVAEVVKELVEKLEYHGPIGCGFPAVVRQGIVFTAANIHPSWIGMNAKELFTTVTGNPVTVINDADAAGIAEMTFGIGRKYPQGVVLMITLGTGIGSAVFVDGKLVPNTEFGHLIIRGKDAELRASDANRKRKAWSYKAWAQRLQEYLSYLEGLIWPDVIILGGGISKDSEKFVRYLNLRAEIKPAQLLNQAGIIGAAVLASQNA